MFDDDCNKVMAVVCPCWTAAKLDELLTPDAMHADDNRPGSCLVDGDLGSGYSHLTLIECLQRPAVDPRCAWQLLTFQGESSGTCWSSKYVRARDFVVENAEF